jgi:hypothetical protein
VASEEEVLDAMYEDVIAAPLIGWSMYPARPGHEAELYVWHEGECWRIRAYKHPHKGD